MEPVPPPHERSWRHPSELAPPPVEPAPRSVRIAATVTGAATVALVGLFALAVTPSDGDDMNAVVGSSSTTIALEGVGQATPTLVSTTSDIAGSQIGATDRLSVVLISANQLMQQDIPADGTAVTVLLSDRLEANGYVLVEIGGVLALRLVEADAASKYELDEFVVATSVPGRHDQVIPMASGGKAHPVELSDIGNKVRLAPGTPVLDSNGELVALCDHRGRPQFIVPPPDPSTSTTVDPTTTSSTTTTTTTVPDTTTTTTSTTSTTTTTSTTSTTSTTTTTTTIPDTTSTTVVDTTTTTSSSSTTSTTQAERADETPPSVSPQSNELESTVEQD